MNLEMQKVLINHAFLESGDQLLSKLAIKLPLSKN
jgi:hypothetical protein